MDGFYGVNGQRERSGDDVAQGGRGVQSKSYLCFDADSVPVVAAELLGTRTMGDDTNDVRFH